MTHTYPRGLLLENILQNYVHDAHKIEKILLYPIGWVMNLFII